MQAPWKSGALITARYAAEEGRDVAMFDHQLLSGGGFNEGVRAFLEDGAQRIELPGLEKRILEAPPAKKEPEQMQLRFWRKQRERRLRWLGGRYYLEE